LSERSSLVEELRSSIASLEKDSAVLREALAQTENHLKSAEIFRSQLEGKLGAVSAEKSVIESIAADKRARLEEKIEAVDGLREQLAQTIATLESSRQELVVLQTERANLEETLGQVQQHAIEKLSLLSDAKEQMTNEFKLLAEELMSRHGESFKNKTWNRWKGFSLLFATN
jgi:DNA recombination protein RmuC